VTPQAPDEFGPDTSVGQVPADRLRTIFDGMFDGVWLVGEDGRTTYANAAMAELLETTADEMRGREITDYLDPADRDQVSTFLARQPTQAGERKELRFRKADGGELLAVVAGSPLSTTEGLFIGTMLNISDVTGKRTIDAQVIQNQRLEAIGQFAGGIAHDFNNLLTSIQGYTQMAMENLAAADPAREDLEQVLASSERATAITRKLLAFTRRQVLMPVDIDPAVVIAGLVPILAPLLGDTRIAMDVDVNHAWVRVDPTQLEQIIMNLALNARDAMPSGGTVRISVHNLEEPDVLRPDPDLTPGPFVRISVADTGVGMDDATKARIFDPFYTTKLDGKGTGFGLSTVFGIVAQSGGQIDVDTALGTGSAFHVDLPRVVAGAKPPQRPSSEPPIRGAGAVLLVEDDPAVREFARRTLEAAGWTVFAAAEADEAIAASRNWRASIEVLLTDIVMPGMHGDALAVLVRKSRPDIGVILMSGYTDHPLGTDTDLGVVEVLNKPFTIDALLAGVARVAEAARLERDAKPTGAVAPR
jgi:two-component system, cell cycle sensor histidine kinase and response regulator CckA